MRALNRRLAEVCLFLVVQMIASYTFQPALAQGDFPNKPVTLIVPWPAGGPTDLALRALAEVAGKHLGQPVVVDNKAGASGTVGAALLASTVKPDGYTVSQLPITAFRLPLMQKTSWDATKDFTYIVHLTGYVFATIARGDGPFNTWADVVAYAKANPGKVTYGTPGAGSTLHLGMEQMAKHAAIELTQVPFKGATEVVTALIGGHIMLGASGASNRPLIESGQIRVLSMWTEKRTRAWPQIPTLAEVGLPFAFESPFGLAGPKGMDPAVVAKLHTAFKSALEDPFVVETMEKFDMVPRYMDAATYAAFVPKLIAEETAALDRIGLLKKP